jgi:hypothetical protein
VAARAESMVFRTHLKAEAWDAAGNRTEQTVDTAFTPGALLTVTHPSMRAT